MRIIFARHGESEANLLHEISNRGLKHGLTLKGREQAKVLAELLQETPVLRIYSSPLLRAVETSTILAQHLGVEYEITDALREYDCGIMEGRSDEDAWRAWHELFDAWIADHELDRRIEGGENFYEIQHRFEPFIQDLIKRYADTSANVVCIGHGGLYWMMLPIVLKNVDVEMIRQYGLEYTSVIVAELRSSGLVCIEWNGHPIDEGSQP